MNYKEYKDNNKRDPELKALIAELRDVPPRDTLKAERTKLAFLAEIEKINENEPKMAQENKMNIVRQIKEYFKMATPRMKKVYQTAGITIIVFAFLFGGAGITAAAASNSLPGDNLYPIKTRIEQTRIQLTDSAEEKVLLNLQYAQERLDEVESLIADGRFSDIDKAVRAYEQYIQKALSELANISIDDPERAQMLFNKIAGSLRSFAMAFENVSSFVGNQSTSFDDVVRFSQSAGTYSGKFEYIGKVSEITEKQWVIGGYKINITAGTEIKDEINLGDSVKIEAWIDSEGKIYAFEMEQTSDEDESFNDLFEIAGIVSEVGEDYLIVNGLRFEFTPESEFDGEMEILEIGDYVKIEAKLLGDGIFLIDEIDGASNGSEDMSDDDEDMDDDDYEEDDIDGYDDQYQDDQYEDEPYDDDQYDYDQYEDDKNDEDEYDEDEYDEDAYDDDESDDDEYDSGEYDEGEYEDVYDD